MPLNVGTTPVKKVYVGTTDAKAVYLGTTQVWSSKFDPTSITGLQVWLDAADVGTLTTQWPDKSGQAHHGTIVGSPAPVVRAGALNGLSVVRFVPDQGRVRGNNGLASGVPSYNGSVTYVVRMVGPNVGRAYTATYPPPNFLVGMHTSCFDCMYDNGWVAAGTGWPALPTPWRMYGSDSSHDGTNYLAHFYINGVLSGTQPGGGAGMGQTYNLSGYDAAGGQETCDCEVAEFLLWNRRISDAERQQVEAYLKTKWGL